ncbi:FdhF/YdeP family oxidoreductase [Acinetobacter albensis]|uniref:Oxidoreductase alpha (Molybdopterin) subunit n=1 Tax=Acinetobacter albensis TaxID=1673609 RepID=A0A1C4GR32_9GAMM|nr:oxidoreductase alpha (molybdopterin) subunit [Acinetobacter albensis]
MEQDATKTDNLVQNKTFGKIEPYHHAAGGWGALLSVARNLKKQEIVKKGAITLLNANQPTGFDCPGCAWPEQKNSHAFNFCENGAKAIAFEATSKRVSADFFAQHSVTWLSQQSDYFLELQGRLTEPMRYDAATDHYVPISWDDAFKLIAEKLHALNHPDEAAFYTSGRTSNEAAFLYQLFIRSFGTNNFPDCSNMCHEATSYGLTDTIGLGKGTVSLDDFELADAIFIFGQNPGTNHPRMLSTLRAASRRGANIISINPLKERGLQRFQDPQDKLEMLTNGSTPISRNYFQPKIGGDYALLVGMMKHLYEWDNERKLKDQASVFDQNFIQSQSVGFETILAEVTRTSWADIHQQTGLSAQELKHLATMFVEAERVIFCWGMGMTQHRHGVANIHMLSNLLLCRGHIGRPGAGACPVRGHSNVQGDRTMGINEHPPEKLLDNLDRVFAMQTPRKHGLGVVDTIKAMAQKQIRVFFAMGGNFSEATPDTLYTHFALRQCELTAHVATKLNRSHLVCGQDALILPCLGRTEVDLQKHGPQSISVEDSMSNVHLSAGRNEPASEHLLSEPDIVARLAAQVLPNSTIQWRWYIENYDRIRNAIAEVFEDFHDFNVKVYQPGGFNLAHPANQHEWRTPSQKAEFIMTSLEDVYADDEHRFTAQYKTQKIYTLMTMRSHDQYNTTLYGLDDRYRGVFGLRRVLFMNETDICEAGFAAEQYVDIESIYSDGVKRVVHQFRIVPYDIPRGCLGAYYPETNPLVALSSHDKRAKIPASKNIPVILLPVKQIEMPENLAVQYEEN